MRRPDALYVSPHADDAVLSAGGAIARATRADRRVLVATVFSDADDGEVRRDEDRRAVARLGAELVELGLPEAPRRDRRLARPSRMFAPIGPGDRAIVDRVIAALRPLLDTLAATTAADRDPDAATACAAPAPEIVGPLGAGEHVDHQLVYAALAALAPPGLRLYEDIPYALVPHAVGRRLARLGAPPVFLDRVAPRAGRLVELLSLARWQWRTPMLQAWSPLTRPLAAMAVTWPIARAWPPRRPPVTDALSHRSSPAAPDEWREERIPIADAMADKIAAIAAYATQHPLFFPDLGAWRAALAAHALAFGSPAATERRFLPPITGAMLASTNQWHPDRSHGSRARRS